jgi:hypothetical protein
VKKLYIPPVIGDDTRSISGSYTAREQTVIQYKDRQVLLIQGNVCLDGFCCGFANWDYIQVIGYLLKPLETGSKDRKGTLEIDTIENQDDQQAIRQILTEKYPNSRIEFD